MAPAKATATLICQLVRFVFSDVAHNVPELPSWGRFRVDVEIADGEPIVVQAVGLTGELVESPGGPVKGHLDRSVSFGDLCRWIHQHLPLRAPPPIACVEAECRCEDEPALLALAVSVDKRASADGSGRSCSHVVAAEGCATDLGRYCPRSCGHCQAGMVLETSRKKPQLPSDFCSDRYRPPWALFTADGEPLSSMPHKSSSLLVLEVGTWTYPPVAVGHVPMPGFQTVSLEPAVFQTSELLLSASEAKEIIKLAESRLSESTVEDFGSGDSSGHSSRTSTVAWLAPEDGPAVRHVFELGQRFLRARLNQFEFLQVVRYLPGQFYQQHHDYFEYWKYPERSKVRDDVLKRTRKGSANRVATLLWYLSEGSSGTTNFPLAGDDLSEVRYEECGQRGVSVSPEHATAVLFYSQLPNGTLDTRSMHAGCPPTGGETKWAANLWLWNADVSEFPSEEASPDPPTADPPNLSRLLERTEV